METPSEIFDTPAAFGFMAHTPELDVVIAIKETESLPEALKIYQTALHQELQKAREEERERIEAIFKEHVPPHAMDLEDSVWLKRLLNKAFGHENIY